MPLGRYPGRVKDFRRWATEKVDQAELSNSATSANKRFRGMRKRRRRRKKKRNSDA